jgi:hypothetical protein
MATIVVGTNSWVTITEADDYLDGKLGADAWASLSNSLKTQCLITAYRWLFYHPDLNIPASSTSETVKAAQIELAWWIYNYYAGFQKRGALIASGVEEFDLSKWSETLKAQDLPYEVANILEDEFTGRGGYFPTVSRTLDNNQSG